MNKIVVSELNWPIGITLLQDRGYDVVYHPDLWNDRERLKTELSDAAALIVRNQTKVNADLLRDAEQLKVIGRLGVGLDNIDLKVCSDHGLTVVYGKNANAASVAEYVISAIFSTVRNLHAASQDVKLGNWNRKMFTKSEVYGKTLGLIGVGEIGHRVAGRARALGMQVFGHDPFVSPYDFPIMESGVRAVSFDQLIEEADFISLHVPLTPGTRNLICENTFKRMKNTACIINTSRGGIIHESDLYQALRKKDIAYAVLDVLEHEPPDADLPLKQLENCMLTPHIAGLTEESQDRTSRMVSNEVMLELSGTASLCRAVIGK